MQQACAACFCSQVSKPCLLFTWRVWPLPVQEEEERRRARRRKKGRIRELEEIRAELAEKVGGDRGSGGGRVEGWWWDWCVCGVRVVVWGEGMLQAGPLTPRGGCATVRLRRAAYCCTMRLPARPARIATRPRAGAGAA